MTATDLIPELRALWERIRRARAEVPRIVDGLSEKQFTRRPAHGGWSVCECIDHLVIVGERLLPRIDDGIALAHRKGWFSRGPFRYGRLGDWFVRASSGDDYPNRRRVKTLKLYEPVNGQSIRSVVGSFDALQANLLERVEACNGIDLRKVRITSPATPLVRLRLGQWLELLVGHQERHLSQAREARRAVRSDSG